MQNFVKRMFHSASFLVSGVISQRKQPPPPRSTFLFFRGLNLVSFILVSRYDRIFLMKSEKKYSIELLSLFHHPNSAGRIASLMVAFHQGLKVI